jgi:amidase
LSVHKSSVSAHRKTQRLIVVLAVGASVSWSAAAATFQIEEATIADIHAAIRSGQTTCKGIVEAYIERAKAYNGVCTALVTRDGASIKPGRGYVRAGKPLVFPTRTVKASTRFPDLDQYQGPPLEFGRMEPTKSDPSVVQQQGMRVGIPDAGQINALETLNLRGERSVTCKGKFDLHPSKGKLPAGAPPPCEEFRKLPDALERAAELDAQYGNNPDLTALPMYCVVAAFKDPFDTQDMRTTSNSDVAFAMDVPPFDATLVAQLRKKGAIIYAKSNAHEFNAGPGDPGGAEKAAFNWVQGGQQVSAWSGQACNPYDTERVVRGSSGGTGAAIGGNLATIGICEQSAASCQGPASRNGTALLLSTKGITPDSGGVGNQWFHDRAGILARSFADSVRTLDALKDPQTGYFDTRDPFTAIAKGLIPDSPYSSFIVSRAELEKNPKPLKGVRIALLREHFLKPTPNQETISDRIDQEVKSVLRDQLGAELVETITPDYADDPSVPNVKYSFADALAELLPRFMPEIFARKNAKGELFFAVPGHDVTTYDYLVKLARHEAPLTPAVKITNFATFGEIDCAATYCADFTLDMDRYLTARGDMKIRSWADWVANAKFRQEASRAGATNWANWQGHTAAGKADHLARSYLARLALAKFMYENDIDLFVHPENTVPTPKIQGPNAGPGSLDGITPFFQIPRIAVPAGATDVVYEPRYGLSEDKKNYVSIAGTEKSRLPHPMPISITFFAGQGDEPVLIKVGSAYEAATRHRFAPPAFGPVATQRKRQ